MKKLLLVWGALASLQLSGMTPLEYQQIKRQIETTIAAIEQSSSKNLAEEQATTARTLIAKIPYQTERSQYSTRVQNALNNYTYEDTKKLYQKERTEIEKIVAQGTPVDDLAKRINDQDQLNKTLVQQIETLKKELLQAQNDLTTNIENYGKKVLEMDTKHSQELTTLRQQCSPQASTTANQNTELAQQKQLLQDKEAECTKIKQELTGTIKKLETEKKQAEDDLNASILKYGDCAKNMDTKQDQALKKQAEDSNKAEQLQKELTEAKETIQKQVTALAQKSREVTTAEMAKDALEKQLTQQIELIQKELTETKNSLETAKTPKPQEAESTTKEAIIFNEIKNIVENLLNNKLIADSIKEEFSALLKEQEYAKAIRKYIHDLKTTAIDLTKEYSQGISGTYIYSTKLDRLLNKIIPKTSL